MGYVRPCIHMIWVRSQNCGCLVTWFCYQLIAKPGNKTAAVTWPDPYNHNKTKHNKTMCTLDGMYCNSSLSRCLFWHAILWKSMRNLSTFYGTMFQLLCVTKDDYITSIAQDCSNSSVLAMESMQSWAELSFQMDHNTKIYLKKMHLKMSPP